MAGMKIHLSGLFIACLCLGGAEGFSVHHHPSRLVRRQGCPNQVLSTRTTTSRSVNKKKYQRIRSSSLVALGGGIGSSNIPSVVDVASIVGGVALLTIYHLRLFLRERRGGNSWRSVQASTREKWSQHVRETESWLYAIQTLRNAITAQTFLASTVLSLLTVISGRLWEIVLTMEAARRPTFLVQFLLVAISMLTSAYCFLQSARLMTHAGFMFPVYPNSTQVDQLLRKSETSQWMGLRCLYCSASFLSWIVGGPRIFFLLSFLLTIFFRSIDQALPLS